LDWSNGEVSTLGGSTSDLSDLQGKRIWDQYLAQHAALSSPNKHNMYSMGNDPALLKNQSFFNLPPNNYESPTSEASFTTGVSSTTIGSDVSRSKELIQDILWLEKKIADRSTTYAGTLATEDNYYDYCSEEDTMFIADENTTKDKNPGRELRCRDCFAPPGKLNIVIRTSADGPIVHTVDESSVLSGQLFKGDLIIAVDDTDTRNMRAEAVMKLMHSKIDRERKITVLHFGQLTP
jgi:C-terminal processing protease CtpA/Prc